MKTKTYIAIKHRNILIEIEGVRKFSRTEYRKGVFTTYFGEIWQMTSMKDAITSRPVEIDDQTRIKAYIHALEKSINLETDENDKFPYNLKYPN